LLEPGTFLTVNVSPETILLPGLADLISREVAPRLILELTEHIPVEDYSPILQALAPLRDIGVRLAVDDTGAGYASFRHILSLDPDVIKLDISLVRDIERDPVRRALVAALVPFARETGFRVIAEGVESDHELAALCALGVRWAQGFHLATPSALIPSRLQVMEGVRT
jgi:EAL domain-containing protein (putative c-di-GMP-specific phosphodiesterase class I)